ncbi:hypothetical protein BC834DRAFT_849205 [Gloeopeniophorella convolvens]|nr:hypothetical protein BC834DRAFT_849205 [Gloeopeniophorella convolvens]
MSDRKSQPSKPSKPRKPSKPSNPQIGAPSEADKAITPVNLPSSSAYSTRTVKPHHVQPLTTICARVFVASFPAFSKDPRQWDPRRKQWARAAAWLRALPDATVQTLFGMLSAACPHLLSHDLVTEHFLRGTALALSSGMGGERAPVSKYTVGRLVAMGPALVRLRLLGFDRMTDQSFAAVAGRLPALEDVSLCGCTLVGPKTVAALAKSCPALTSINLNYTSVTPISLVPLLRSCKERLQVLKVAGISSWTDAAFSKLHAELMTTEDFSLPALRTLKLRQTSLTDTSICALISLAPNVTRVDVSFTSIRRPLSAPHYSLAGLEKLAVTSTSVPPDHLLDAVAAAPRLRTLNIGALGGSLGQRSAFGSSMSTVTMTDDHLSCLTTVLSENQVIESVSLVGNAKLCRSSKSLVEFIRLVGRRLKILNLSGIPSLRSMHLETLSPEEPNEAVCTLQELLLSSTGVDDDAATYISCCPSLETLDVAGTRLSADALFTIIDSCPKLAQLDLTRCRGVSVTDRRRFFEVWQEHKEQS